MCAILVNPGLSVNIQVCKSKEGKELTQQIKTRKKTQEEKKRERGRGREREREREGGGGTMKYS